MVDWNGTTEFALDKLGQITKTNDHAGNVTSFAYDGLDRLVKTTGHEAQKAKNQEFSYDSLGNLVYKLDHNKATSYKYNSLNQQAEKLADGKDLYVNTFDKRGNLVKTIFEKNKNQSYVTQEYAYDATNRMVKGINEDGEQSHYVFNGFGDLVANEWIVAKNAYSYHRRRNAKNRQQEVRRRPQGLRFGLHKAAQKCYHGGRKRGRRLDVPLCLRA
ncbi:MAG: RHS repeat protein [Clostridiales bacterium]|nr:RHS repeat protein [Clostridiales bacterium]